jgi:tetratricopeptide (TPR) repeat protein
VHNRAYAWYLKGDYDRAIAGFTDMIKRSSSNEHKAVGYAGRARARVRTKDVRGALADCDRAHEVEPNSPWGHEYRAWIRATCPDAKFRDGTKAVEEATIACELTEWKNPPCLETLAAAAAESGDFDAAVRWQSMALESLTDDELTPQFRDRLELYRKKHPYRDVPSMIGSR